MITATRYAQITGDTSSATSAVDEALPEAVALLEDYLDRPIYRIERTEQLRPDRAGQLWPRAVPLHAADDYEIDGYALIGAGPFGLPSFIDPDTSITVTYTGGWVDRFDDEGDPVDDPGVMPTYVERDLCWAAYRLLHPTAPTSLDVPANATSVRLGDASITFEGTAGDIVTGDTDSWWSRRTRGHRYRPVGTPVGCG